MAAITRADRHEKHLQPERKRHQFAHRLADHHQDSGRQQQTQRACQPGTEPAGGLPQRLIHPGPSQDAEIDHEYGTSTTADADDVNGLNGRDHPTVMVLDEDAQEMSWTATRQIASTSAFLLDMSRTWSRREARCPCTVSQVLPGAGGVFQGHLAMALRRPGIRNCCRRGADSS